MLHFMCAFFMLVASGVSVIYLFCSTLPPDSKMPGTETPGAAQDAALPHAELPAPESERVAV